MFTAFQCTLPPVGPVSEPTISDCDDDSSINCTLICEGTGDGPLTYTWFDDEGQKTTGSTLIVEKKSSDMVYTCQVSNLVSKATSRKTVPKVFQLSAAGSQTGQKARQDVC